MEDTETKPSPFLAEISCTESPVVDPKQHGSSESIVSEKAAENKNGNSPSSNDLSEPPSSCSKRQLKRLKKMQNRQKIQTELKLQRKLKNRARRARNKLAELRLEKPKITSMSESKRKFTVVIDFSYDELMSPKDLIKCGNQVIRCYSANRRSSNPMQLHFCNFAGKIEAELAKNNGYRKWDINFHECNYLDLFNKSDLVYLTSESRNVLDSLEENKVYIVGGLVDHNSHKGVSYRKAVHEEIAHAQLPIKKHMHLKSRSVLTINHVSNGESWSKALLSAVPPRFFEAGVTSNESKDNLISDSSPFDEEKMRELELSQCKAAEITEVAID